MRKINFCLVIISFLISCHSNKTEKNKSNDFEKSYKEEKGEGFTEYLDSTTNIYSNFRYHVAFDGPNNWKTDAGVSEHTIFRTYQSDSTQTFSINVIELNFEENEKKSTIDIWEFYKNHKEQMDYPFTTLIEEQLKTKVNDFSCEHSYIKNNSCLKRKFNYNIRDLDIEYNVTIISYQTYIDGFTYTFSLNIPTVFYNEKREYYDALFTNVYLLKDGERLDEILKQVNKRV